MKAHYQEQQIITKEKGNNAFSFHSRKNPQITIPSLKEINHVDEVKLGQTIVFEEINDQGVLRSCHGLEHLYKIAGKPNIIIMDNHNHALYRWGMHALQYTTPLTVYHIDQHSDLAQAPQTFNHTKRDDHDYLREFSNVVCNVGNFIKPALEADYINGCHQVRTEGSLKALIDSKPKGGYILDIDLDFRAPEMSINHYQKTIEHTQQLALGASLITVASSPYFIEQNKALEVLRNIFPH